MGKKTKIVPRIQKARPTVKIPGDPLDPGAGSRVQPKRPHVPVESSRTGGFGAVAPETLNVAHVPYDRKKTRIVPEPAPKSRPVFKNGLWQGKLRAKKSK